jgi:hypothetical protein
MGRCISASATARGKINSILRLEGITDYITITIDDTVVCEKGVFKIRGNIYHEGREEHEERNKVTAKNLARPEPQTKKKKQI